LRSRARSFGGFGLRQIVFDIFGYGFLSFPELLTGRNARLDRHFDNLPRVPRYKYAYTNAEEKGGDYSTHALLPS
jgi:hypothetical protein